MWGRALRFSLVFLVLTGLVYPLVTTALARALFPYQAEGSLIRLANGSIVGSELIGQAFTDPRYFHGRVSAVRYNAAHAGGSNAGPTDPALLERVRADLATWKEANPGQPVPADLLASSGSGVDPHISPEAALTQVPRVARANGLPEAEVRALVEEHVEGRTLGIFGEPRVNVLKLNLALRKLTGR